MTAGEHRSFEVEIVVERRRRAHRATAGGERSEPILRTCLNGRPLVGEQIELDGTIHRVVRVLHRQEEARSVRVYLVPRLVVRAVRS